MLFMYILKAIFPSCDQADIAQAEILARYGDCAQTQLVCPEHREKETDYIALPYQAYSGSVSTGGEMPMIPIPAVLNVDVPVSGDCTLTVKCSDGKKAAVSRILRGNGAMSIDIGELG